VVLHEQLPAVGWLGMGLMSVSLAITTASPRRPNTTPSDSRAEQSPASGLAPRRTTLGDVPA